jgi:hypothetical protein
MKKLIVIADWAGDSLTNQEVRSAGIFQEQLGSADNVCRRNSIDDSYLVPDEADIDDRRALW